MSKLDTAPYKGVRDFYPEEQFIQNYIFNIWKKTMESFGYVEYGASILESTELYKAKSGDEIVNEQTYTFKDRGDRDVTLRPEMTPTVARMVAAKRRELGFPLRWYSIPNLFRYEAPQRGRLREHWQLNADIFGVSGIEADIEIIALAYRVMKNFGAKNEDFEIRLNSHNANPEALEQVIAGLKFSGINNFRIDETLARGQSYYTGVVFEFFDMNTTNSRSILGGGRYDNLTALFEDFDMPAAGFGAGDVTMRDFLETHGLLPQYRSTTDLFLVCKDTTVDAVVNFHTFTSKLREAGINVATDQSRRENGDLYKVAERDCIPYIGFVSAGEVTVKNMQNRDEHKFTFDSAEDIKNLVKKS